MSIGSQKPHTRGVQTEKNDPSAVDNPVGRFLPNKSGKDQTIRSTAADLHPLRSRSWVFLRPIATRMLLRTQIHNRIPWHALSCRAIRRRSNSHNGTSGQCVCEAEPRWLSVPWNALAKPGSNYREWLEALTAWRMASHGEDMQVGVPARVTRSLHTVLPSSFIVEPTPRSNALRILHPFCKKPGCEV
jgi:hypothetical protein